MPDGFNQCPLEMKNSSRDAGQNALDQSECSIFKLTISLE